MMKSPLSYAEYLTQTFQKNKWQELESIFQDIVPEGSLSVEQLSDWIDTTQSIARSFQKLAISGYIESFDEENILMQLLKPTEFSLSLIRDSEKKSIYGIQHVTARQQLWNCIPQKLRVQLLQQKLKGMGIEDQVNKIISKSAHATPKIVDATDIGKAHTIYKLDIENANQSFSYVLKRDWTNSQRFFEAVCVIFGKAIIASYPLFAQKSSYTLLNFLPGQPLHQLDSSLIDVDRIIEETAFQAAIGDYLGRGDRHFENYLWANDHLYPLDISYMFDDHHLKWLNTYTSAGMYEVNSIYNLYEDVSKKDQMIAYFFDAYREWRKKILKYQTQLERMITAYFPGQCQKYIKYIQHSVQNTEECINVYEKGLEEYRKRLIWKQRLEMLAHQLELSPSLKMMHLSHEERPSAFYQIENVAPNAWKEIKRLENES